MISYDDLLKGEQELDEYRQQVERHLGPWLSRATDKDLDRLFHYVEWCFDWGVTAPACARTWVAKETAT
jgi:hypothetical protein